MAGEEQATLEAQWRSTFQKSSINPLKSHDFGIEIDIEKIDKLILIITKPNILYDVNQQLKLRW